MVRIVVVDAQTLVGEGLRSLLSVGSQAEVVGIFQNGRALLTWLEQNDADVALMDVSLPGMDGIDTTRELTQRFPKVRVLAYSELSDIEYVNSMLIEGALGYLMKGADRDELLKAIRATHAGERYMSAEALKSVKQGYKYTSKRIDGAYVRLTEREREVIRLVAMERTNKEIAEALGVKEETVKTHRKQLMTKLNVRSSAGLVKYAVDRRWV